MKTFKVSLLKDISELDLCEELPVKVISGTMKVIGSITLFFGGSFVLIPLAYLIKTLVTDAPVKEALPLLPVAVVFLPLMLLGLNLITKKQVMVIDHDRISKSVTSLFKKKKWEEPITSYDGLLLRTDIQVTGERSSRLVYALELLHKEKSKTIQLFKIRSTKMFSINGRLTANSLIRLPWNVSVLAFILNGNTRISLRTL
ncbi:MAG: hypothetical protein GY757_05470 [bacterium]|nr:hypothetical protein [bacterium]